MNSAAITTIVKMMESLPVERQEQVLDHMREYLADLDDETEWDMQFAKTKERLQAVAKEARKEFQAGEAGSLDFDR